MPHRQTAVPGRLGGRHAATIAARRTSQTHPVPAEHSERSGNDLLKCLEKDPRHRYASADALAHDLRAFENGEPIRGRPAGVISRTAKWCRRRPAVATLAAVAASALITTIAS